MRPTLLLALVAATSAAPFSGDSSDDNSSNHLAKRHSLTTCYLSQLAWNYHCQRMVHGPLRDACYSIGYADYVQCVRNGANDVPPPGTDGQGDAVSNKKRAPLSVDALNGLSEDELKHLTDESLKGLSEGEVEQLMEISHSDS